MKDHISTWKTHFSQFFGEAALKFNGGQEAFLKKKCPVNKCYMTTDKQEFATEDLDAVLFHGSAYDKSIPEKRYEHICSSNNVF